jgi:hypothetical protein
MAFIPAIVVSGACSKERTLPNVPGNPNIQRNFSVASVNAGRFSGAPERLRRLERGLRAADAQVAQRFIVHRREFAARPAALAPAEDSLS